MKKSIPRVLLIVSAVFLISTVNIYAAPGGGIDWNNVSSPIVTLPGIIGEPPCQDDQGENQGGGQGNQGNQGNQGGGQGNQGNQP